jgi:murein DD-endopeptidase MepM/ murein hydrolase activator NlpD
VGAHRPLAASRRPHAVPARHLHRPRHRRRRRRGRQPPRRRRRRRHHRRLHLLRRRPHRRRPRRGRPHLQPRRRRQVRRQTHRRTTRIQAASQQQAVGAGLCPVAGPATFTDTWLAPRSGGRQHQGVDIFAPEGTPVIAVAPGRLEHYNNTLGGLSYRLYADDGTYYYGTHLSAYANQDAGHVDAGTVIGYVGRTGNAATTPAHLHWEIHPAGRGTPAINPTPTTNALCATNQQ